MRRSRMLPIAAISRRSIVWRRSTITPRPATRTRIRIRRTRISPRLPTRVFRRPCTSLACATRMAYSASSPISPRLTIGWARRRRPVPLPRWSMSPNRWYGQGVSPDPRRAVEWAERAADAGSVDAKVDLGLFYFYGYRIVDDNGDVDAAKSVLSDNSRALLWFGRAALANNARAQYNLAMMMEAGDGLPIPQPEIAARYYRLAAHGGFEDAEIDLAERLRSGVFSRARKTARTKPLICCVARSARVRLEPPTRRNLSQRRVRRDQRPAEGDAICLSGDELSAEADPATEDGDPFFEADAGILLAEMAVNGQANDINGKPLLDDDEIERLQKFYGTVNPDMRKVEVRKLEVPLGCAAITPGLARSGSGTGAVGSRRHRTAIPQHRTPDRLLRQSTLRRTLAASFLLAKKTEGSLRRSDLSTDQGSARYSGWRCGGRTPRLRRSGRRCDCRHIWQVNGTMRLAVGEIAWLLSVHICCEARASPPLHVCLEQFRCRHARGGAIRAGFVPSSLFFGNSNTHQSLIRIRHHPATGSDSEEDDSALADFPDDEGTRELAKLAPPAREQLALLKNVNASDSLGAVGSSDTKRARAALRLTRPIATIRPWSISLCRRSSRSSAIPATRVMSPRRPCWMR